jgi:phosphoribosylanthranilate isomerase
MLIQIYEIRSAGEARRVAEAGVDHIGVLVGPGEFPREIGIQDAKIILEAIPEPCRKVVLTLSRDIAAIKDTINALNPHVLHLGTLPEAITPQDIASIKRIFPAVQFMRSIPVVGRESVELAKQYDGIADFLLLDSHRANDQQVGATGVTHDWSISRMIVESVRTPVILAGGLGPENVADAIRQVRPAGVDSKTKTDQDGSHTKDLEKIRKFVEAVRK